MTKLYAAEFRWWPLVCHSGRPSVASSTFRTREQADQWIDEQRKKYAPFVRSETEVKEYEL